MAIRKIGDVERVDSIAAEDGILLERGGALKRIDAEQVGGTSKMVIFRISSTNDGSFIAKSDGVTFASADEILDAYFAGNAYVFVPQGAYTDENGVSDVYVYAPGEIVGFEISGKYYNDPKVWFNRQGNTSSAIIHGSTNKEFEAKLNARMAQMGGTPQ